MYRENFAKGIYGVYRDSSLAIPRPIVQPGILVNYVLEGKHAQGKISNVNFRIGNQSEPLWMYHVVAEHSFSKGKLPIQLTEIVSREFAGRQPEFLQGEELMVPVRDGEIFETILAKVLTQSSFGNRSVVYLANSESSQIYRIHTSVLLGIRTQTK